MRVVQSIRDVLTTILRSRRVLVAIAFALVSSLTLLIPGLAVIHDELVVLVVAILLVLVSQFGVQTGSGAAPGVDEQEVRRLIREIHEEMSAIQPTQNEELTDVQQ